MVWVIHQADPCAGPASSRWGSHYLTCVNSQTPLYKQQSASPEKADFPSLSGRRPRVGGDGWRCWQGGMRPWAGEEGHRVGMHRCTATCCSVPAHCCTLHGCTATRCMLHIHTIHRCNTACCSPWPGGSAMHQLSEVWGASNTPTGAGMIPWQQSTLKISLGFYERHSKGGEQLEHLKQ